ncbi:MAG: phage tail protein [Gammaproteobacteria bacterium]
MQFVVAAVQIGFAIYSLVKSKPKNIIEGPRLGDLAIQSSARGAPLARAWGSMRIAGNVIDGRKFEIKTEEDLGGGGKGFGGGGSTTQITYNYYGDFAVSLCEGPIVGVRRIWLNNKLWYDVSDTASSTAIALSAEHKKFFKLYTGTVTQNPDPTLEAIHGAGSVPPYRHTAYLVFTALPLDVFGNAIPHCSGEVVTAGSGTLPAISQFDADGGPGSEAVDPETGYLWAQYDGTANSVKVYNTGTGALVKEIPFNGGGQMAYVPSTRKFWAASKSPGLTTTPDAVIMDANAMVVSQSIEFTTGSTHWPGCCMYNPIGDLVLIAGSNGGDLGITAVFAAASGVFLGYLAPAPPNWVLSALAAEEYGVGVFAGFGNWLWVFPLSMTENPPDVFSVAATTFTVAEFSSTSNYISYDRGRGLIWWASTSHTNVYKLDLATNILSLAGTLPATCSGGMVYAEASDRLYALNGVSGLLYVIDPGSFALEDTLARDTGGGLFAHNGASYLIGSAAWKIPIVRQLPQTGVALSQIVTDLCVEAGLTAGDINVSQLTNIVPGYLRAQPMEAAAAIDPLMTCYLFDGVESDYILKFPKRGGASAATLTEDKLGAHAFGETKPDPITIDRVQEVELPNAVSVHYIALKYDYQQGTQIKKRLIGRSKDQVTVELPIALTNDSARQLANILMDNAWTERTHHALALAIDSIALDPADIITVNLDDGSSHVLRLTKVDFGAPGLLRLEAVSEDVANYTSDAGAQADSIPPPVFDPIANTRLELIDGPILQDIDNNAGFYYAMAGRGPGWDGAMLYKSIDGGATYGVLDAMANAAAIGTASTALATGPATIWDNGNTVTVFLTQGTLASDTESNVLAGKNAAFLGVHGRWELIQWQTATLNAGGSYTLSKLLRGRKGTEHALGNHAIGDTFVALTRTTVDRAAMATSEIAIQRHYKAVSVGQNLQEATAQAFTNTGVGLECYSPVNIKGTRVANGDLTITWIRRTRAAGEWRDAVDVPLFETSELYDLEIWDSGYVTLKRTFSDLTSQSQVYTSGQQGTDFGGNQAAVSVRVYQKSSVVARGYPGSATV